MTPQPLEVWVYKQKKLRQTGKPEMQTNCIKALALKIYIEDMHAVI